MGKWGPSPFIAFVAGAATVAAFSPFGFYPLALVTFAWLAHAWSARAPRDCAWLGFTFGLGLFGAGVSWVYVSLHQFGGMPAVLAGFATIVFCAFLALFPAGAGWLQARVPANPAVRAALLIPAAWTLLEWLRSWILTGFPWLSLGYAAVGWPLQGYAPLGGVFALTFVTVSLAGMLGLIVLRAPRPAPLSVALLQGNIEQSLKFDPARYERTLETYARLAEGSRARLVIFPETAVPRFLDQVDRAYLRRLDAAAERNGAAFSSSMRARARQT